jgi:hypothetical protein
MRIRRDTAAATVLWVTAVGLMVWDTARPGPLGEIAAWSLLTSCGAAVTTLSVVLRRSRHVILEVMAWERWHLTHEDEVDQRRNVRAIR